MATSKTIENGFKAGDKATPDSSNIWAKAGVIVTVIEVEDYSMTIEYPDGKKDFVHPYRWVKV